MFLSGLAQEWAVTTLHADLHCWISLTTCHLGLRPPLVFQRLIPTVSGWQLRGRRVWATLLALCWPITAAVAIAAVAAYRGGHERVCGNCRSPSMPTAHFVRSAYWLLPATASGCSHAARAAG